METTLYDFIVIGGGIVGLATARELSLRFPAQKIAVIEKEEHLASHQTGHNSGVIHSGIYYRPESLKAKTCVEGAGALKEFCSAHQVPIKITGKLILATHTQELVRLEDLYARGLANKVSGLRILTGKEIQEIEPYARGIKAIWVPSTGTVDYPGVCQKFAEIIRERGGDIYLHRPIGKITPCAEEILIRSGSETWRGRYAFNCAGLQADRVARMAGIRPAVRLIPFRGEYYRISTDRQDLVRGLIYPVPDPAFPFLGVHFTKMIDGRLEVGPNAVLALEREGYHRCAFSFLDTWETFSYPGFWRMAKNYWKRGLEEMLRSWLKILFVASAQRLVPALRMRDFIPDKTGIRAQALDTEGNLCDDFSIETSPRMVHVLNAPSPAATACIPIARMIVEMAQNRLHLG